MAPRIAIPIPHFTDQGFNERALPQYERAVLMAGGEPVRIPLDQKPAEIMKLIERCDAVLLPGSKADVDPAKYGAARGPYTEAADSARDTVDELLLQDAYNMRKPVLGICYGLQILNVYRSGTLLQHIESPVKHEAGHKVPVAHTVAVEPESLLSDILRGKPFAFGFNSSVSSGANHSPATQAQHTEPTGNALTIPANSSHHQSAEIAGDGLRIVAHCPDDGVIEALEGTANDHFVLAVQWHPERSVNEDERSRRIFRALVEAAQSRHQKLAGEFETV